MSVPDLATYLVKAGAPWQRLQLGKNASTSMVTTNGFGRLHTHWVNTPNAGASPTTAAVPASTIAGAAGQRNSSGVQRVSRCTNLDQVLGWGTTAVNSLNPYLNEDIGSTLYLIDRLSHQGGLDPTVTTPQTTNLPTAALTRYTDGIGVMIGLQLYGSLNGLSVGNTVTSVSVSYTNQAGTAGRTSPLVVFGGPTNREVGRLIPIPLQSGDIGVKSVESVTVTSTTGTGGSGGFGVVLYRIIDCIPMLGAFRRVAAWDAVLHRGGYSPRIFDDACLFLGVTGKVVNSMSGHNLEVQLYEE